MTDQPATVAMDNPQPSSEVSWLDKAARLDGIADNLMLCCVALRGAMPNRNTMGPVIVQLRSLLSELEGLRNQLPVGE